MGDQHINWPKDSLKLSYLNFETKQPETQSLYIFIYIIPIAMVPILQAADWKLRAYYLQVPQLRCCPRSALSKASDLSICTILPLRGPCHRASTAETLGRRAD